MKSFKYFLALPMAITALAACGGGGQDNFTETDFDNAKTIVENYAESIKNSKASGVTVSGHINGITVDGDATWWSYTPQEDYADQEVMDGNLQKSSKMSTQITLLSMIPNFSVKDSQIIVDAQDIASFTLPGSLVSLGDTSIPNSSRMLLIAASLPKFPMNCNLLRTISGLESLPKEASAEEWGKVKDKKWEKATVTFYNSGNGRLKVTLATDDIEAFFNELSERYFGDGAINDDPEPEPTKKYPGSFTITTSNLGYVDSLSVNFKVEDVKIENKDSDIFYLYLNGDLSIDLGLTFKQTICDPVTLKYQLSVYHPTTETEKADIEYPIDGELIPLTYDASKSKPLTSNLDDFKDYLTFDWYDNLQNNELVSNFDDPVFCYNYWNGNAKNIAFTNEAYDVLAIPAYTIKDGDADIKCAVLGGEFHEFGVAPKINSQVTTSINGRVVSENGLIEGMKALNAAGDAIIDIRRKDTTTGTEIRFDEYGDEIFINSSMINANDSEYIVNIAIAVPNAK